MREAGRGAEAIGDVLMKTPGLLQNIAQAISGFSEMARTGVRLDDQTVENIKSSSKRSRVADAALLIGALSLAAIALKLLDLV